MALHWKILIGLSIGAVSGLLTNAFVDKETVATLSSIGEAVGHLFLRIIFMVVVPLVFCALTLGVAGIGDARKLGRIGLQTLVMTLVFSSDSVLIGLALANTVQPARQSHVNFRMVQ
jgi:DAACS family dicarboxylate/amino acid:cation (Na+ or H+) symporter